MAEQADSAELAASPTAPLSAAFSGQTFQCILADPPWHFQTWSSKGAGKSASQHYAVQDRDWILGLGPAVQALAARDSALFLWAVDCMLPQALAVISAWGFRYVNVGFTWAKQSRTGRKWHFGMGYYTRTQTEQCLLAVRGKPKVLSHAVRQLVVAPVREHSRKPEEVRDRIEALVPGPRLEMFARSRREGWESWGSETDRF